MAKEGLITAKELADYLNCSVSTIRRLVVKSDMPHFRLGKLVRFRRGDIDMWLRKFREGDLSVFPRETPRHPDQLTLFGPEIGSELEF